MFIYFYIVYFYNRILLHYKIKKLITKIDKLIAEIISQRLHTDAYKLVSIVFVNNVKK